MATVYRLKKVAIERSKGGASFTLLVPEFDVPRGSFTAIVGQSGCGKSTLLDLLGLVLAPDSAEKFELTARDGEQIEIFGEGPRRISQIRRQYLGYILQSGGLMPFLSVAKNLAVARMLNPKRQIEPQALEEMVFHLGLEDHLAKKPSQLSGGQRQRVAIARAIAQNPDIILADEPTGSVDKFTAVKIRDLLLSCAKRAKVSVLMVTHDESLVRDVADSVYSFELTQASGQLKSSLQRIS
jgi:putative ABC transport system ATP-binding protein